MSPLEVHGRDSAEEAYRVSLETESGLVLGLVPETLMGKRQILGAPRHQHAYEWLASNRSKIEAALRAKQAGKPARAPFDRVTIVEE